MCIGHSVRFHSTPFVFLTDAFTGKFLCGGDVGGSLRDVQALAGHSSLAVTQRYIEGDEAARAKVVELV